MRYFLSYSRVDAGDLAVDLANRLTAGPPSFPVWLDQCDLRPGDDWDDQIVEAIRECRVLLFVMTEDSVESDSGCKDEWVRALKYKKTIIPLRFRPRGRATVSTRIPVVYRLHDIVRHRPRPTA